MRIHKSRRSLHAFDVHTRTDPEKPVIEESARKTLATLLKKHRFAMLTTIETNDMLHSRPMTTIERDFDGTLWFFAKSDSETATALRARSSLCASFSEPKDSEFVCVSGEGTLVEDTAKKRELWNSAVQAWFPEGPNSSSNLLIQLTPNHAEYWDSSSSKLVQLFSFAKALITHRPPRDIGEHREVPLP
jgi:general stress protein 26